MAKLTYSQLPLSLKTQDEAVFATYLIGANRQAVDALKSMVTHQQDPYLFIWGKEVGCTHLLRAVCYLARDFGLTSLYAPLDRHQEFSPSDLKVCYNAQIVCLDHIEAIAGHAGWEEAIFHLFNHLRDHGRQLVVSSSQPLKSISFGLADLSSRLLWGPPFTLHSLTDEEKLQALRARAKSRGFDLPEQSAQFILYRSGRSIKKLFSVLDSLDEASLQQQRKLTKPFIKAVMKW